MTIAGKKPVSLYFHIPFCSKKCPYCHFYVIPNDTQHQKILLHSLNQEWNLYRSMIEQMDIVSIYFGGGTPTLFVNYLSQVLSWIPQSNIAKDCEITVEANPEDVTDDLAKQIIDAGINRVSIGVQSLDDSQLQLLGRTHNAKRAIQSVETFNRAGINNISIDLMYELPHQKIESWNRTIKKACDLPICHLSLYNLTIEPHTQFFKRKNSIEKTLPEPEQNLLMLTNAVKHFETHGFNRYEISAFAKEGYESKHNMGYWSSRSYLGFGPSACSYHDGVRWKNYPNLHRHAKSLSEQIKPIESIEKLEDESKIAEHLILHLRRIQGVDLDHFFKLFGKIPADIQKDINKLHQSKYLQRSANTYKLTDRGLLFYDYVASELIRLPEL